MDRESIATVSAMTQDAIDLAKTLRTSTSLPDIISHRHILQDRISDLRDAEAWLQGKIDDYKRTLQAFKNQRAAANEADDQLKSAYWDVRKGMDNVTPPR